MNRYFPAIVCVITVTFSGCAAEPQPAETLQPRAVSAAQQHGASELGCSAATAGVLRAETVEEAQGTGWYEPPHKAMYTVNVSGCGKRTTYSVACDDRQTSCVVGPITTVNAPLADLADKLQPGAVKVAQQRGASELGCPAATTEVLRAETVEEPQGTGWYDPPHRAVYTVDVSGCGKRTEYVVACDSEKNNCVAGALQKIAAEGSAPISQLAEQLKPDAVKVAQQHGSTELNCPEATAKALRAETIEEPQTTGWYEPPHRAVYTVDVSGCGKRTSYLVACDDRNKRCTAGSVQNKAGE